MSVADRAREGSQRHLPGAAVVAASRVDEITDRLTTAVAIGEYLPGTRLPSERDLAESLKAGRMTVRAALNRLVSQGLLETRVGRGGGSFVRETDVRTSGEALRRTLGMKWQHIEHLSDVINRVQGLVAGAAAENRTDDDLAAIHERLGEFLAAPSGSESQRADSRLHSAILEAAHNPVLSELVLGLEAQVSLVTPAHMWGAAPDTSEMEKRATKDHLELVAAISNGDAPEAERVGRRHSRIDYDLMSSALAHAHTTSTD